jgi:hypothetical protein
MNQGKHPNFMNLQSPYLTNSFAIRHTFFSAAQVVSRHLQQQQQQQQQ